MKKTTTYRKIWTSIFAVAMVATLSGSAAALDSYQDRRGFFSGIGLGGGGAFQDGNPGGAMLFDFQLGGGATKNLTLALAVGIVMLWNFFVNRYWTYNDVD